MRPTNFLEGVVACITRVRTELHIDRPIALVFARESRNFAASRVEVDLSWPPRRRPARSDYGRTSSRGQLVRSRDSLPREP